VASRTRTHTATPTPPVPRDVLRVLRHGGTAALVCAAASSAVTLFWLAVLVGWPHQLAWLLPASLDVYAGTSLYVGYRLPTGHPAAASAARNARFALSLTVGSNGLYHALTLFGSAWPVWVHDSLLVAVSALPPVVVERLLHLRSIVGTAAVDAGPVVAAPAAPAVARPGAVLPAVAAPAVDRHPVRAALEPAAPKTAAAAESRDSVPAPAAAVSNRVAKTATAATGNGNVIPIGSGRRDPGYWAATAGPHYRRHQPADGTEIPAKQFAEILRAAGIDVPASDRGERNVRNYARDWAKDNSTDDQADEPERDREVA
jgi:hypothetical protein